MFAARTNWSLETNAFTVALEEAKRSGRRLLDLTASNPTTVGFHFEQERILGSLSHPEALVYEPASTGLLSARSEIAGYYSGLGTSVAPDQVVLTVSTSEAYTYCFRLLCDPGDEVLIPTPSYPLFEFLAGIQDVKLVPYELVYDYGWQIEFGSLERAISPRTRAIMVVHPNNPTGHYTKPWELERLNAVAAKHELAIISDEVFLDYGLSDETPLSFAANREALTFTLSGLSKICALPQIKVAWLVASGPEALRRDALARLDVIADTYLSPNAPVQNAIPELLGTQAAIQAQLNRRTRANLSELDAQLANQSACSRLVVDAGWYATLRVPVTRTDEELAIELLRAGVLVHPGHFFDFPGDGYLVLSLITPEEDFRQGVEILLRKFSQV